jgi:hypothetical protein
MSTYSNPIAKFRSLFLAIIVFVALAQGSFCPAQTLWEGMEEHVKLTPYASKVDLTNVDSSALTAVFWDYRCPFKPLLPSASGGPRMGVSRHTGTFDVALTHGYPLKTGDSLHMAAFPAGCSGGPTAIIYADGREFGDPVVLRRLHDCRAVSKEELDQVLHQDLLLVPISRWDPQQSLDKLKARKAAFHFPMDDTMDENAKEMQSCRVFEIDNIATGIAEFQSSEAGDPAYYTPSRSVFLEGMLEKDRLMTSSTYKRSNINWKKPILPTPSEAKP